MVLKARHFELGTLVAVKVLLDLDPESLARFQQEGNDPERGGVSHLKDRALPVSGSRSTPRQEAGPTEAGTNTDESRASPRWLADLHDPGRATATVLVSPGVVRWCAACLSSQSTPTRDPVKPSIQSSRETCPSADRFGLGQFLGSDPGESRSRVGRAIKTAMPCRIHARGPSLPLAGA